MRTLLAAVAITAASLTGPGWHPALPVAADAPASSAPYYVVLSGTGAVSVINGFSGRTTATVPAPDRSHIDGIAAARDDRTFVLYTSHRFYELRLGTNGRPQWLTAVAGDPPSAGMPFAISPDAGLAAYPTGTGITVVSLITGATRSWPPARTVVSLVLPGLATVISRSSGSRSTATGRRAPVCAC